MEKLDPTQVKALKILLPQLRKSGILFWMSLSIFLAGVNTVLVFQLVTTWAKPPWSSIAICFFSCMLGYASCMMTDKKLKLLRSAYTEIKDEMRDE